MNYTALWFVLLAVWSLPSPCHSEDKVYKLEGDLIIGGIIPLHFNNAPRRCGGSLDLSALRRVEAMRYAISEINSGDLLGGITLGYEIYDSCASLVETLKHALKFVPEVRKAHHEDDNIIGVVGPQRSANSIQTTMLLGLYNITSVSYLSTSDELSDSDRFPYFIRTVPPDKFQVSVITDILKKYQWNYVAFLHSDDTYGSNAEAEFRVQAEENDICIGYTRGISGSEDDDVYHEVTGDLLELKEESLFSVVVLFTQQETAAKIFEHATKANVSRDFIWIGSDGWGNYDLTPVDRNEEAALGAFTIVPKADINPGFNDFFRTAVFCDNSTANPSSNLTRNPWLLEYCQVYNDTTIQRITLPPYESLVIDSVYVIAQGLHDMKGNMCNDNVTECILILLRNRRLLRDYFLNVTFNSSSNGPVSFTRNGDAKGSYDIRYLIKEDMSYRFIANGTWLENEEPKLVVGPVPWYLKETNRNTYTEEHIPKSVCSDPCETTQVTRMIPQDCCWTCDTCEDSEIIVGSKCVSCFFETNQTYMWPDPTLTHCVLLNDLKLVHKVGNVIFLTFALLGVTVEIVIAYLYIKNRDKRLIKASSRELGYIILVGIFLAYFSAMLYCIPVHIVSCYLRRIVPSLATTFIYVSLLTMTVRLYRIFTAGERTTRRPQFISQTSQVALTLVISIIPVVWGLVWIFIHRPVAAVIPPTKDRQIIEKMCIFSKAHRIGQLVWDVFIVLVNCYFAIRARSLPANYNQTRFIAFSVFSTLVVLIAFAPAFFTTNISNQQDMYSALGYIIQPTVVLILIFIARIYAIYFVEEKDQHVVSTRESVRKTSEVVAAPSQVRTVSAGTVDGSTPNTSRSWIGDRSVSDVLAQTEAEVHIGPIIYKSPSRHLNSDETSDASSEIHSIEDSEAEVQTETDTQLGVTLQNTGVTTPCGHTYSPNSTLAQSPDDLDVDQPSFQS